MVNGQVPAVVIYMLMRKLGEYEPGLATTIRAFVDHSQFHFTSTGKESQRAR